MSLLKLLLASAEAISSAPVLAEISDAAVERMARLGTTMLDAEHLSVLDTYVQVRLAVSWITVRTLAGLQPDACCNSLPCISTHCRLIFRWQYV